MNSAIAKFIALPAVAIVWLLFEAVPVLFPVVADFHGINAHDWLNNVAQMLVGLCFVLFGWFWNSREILPYFFYALAVLHALNF
ncbi:hypothetical protein [Thiothrix sp.]|jgi:hypothetical protein|uniref:hypothetical protein n=1 Tax=Thiothrix sp. TaxID=1032 RepID=UPI00257F3122|nr:hypothetical protein [Thiothrix sp.]